MLQKIVKQTYGIVIVGIVFLIVFLGINLYSEQCRGEQLENTVYLNKYACVYYNVCSICMKNMLVEFAAIKESMVKIIAGYKKYINYNKNASEKSVWVQNSLQMRLQIWLRVVQYRLRKLQKYHMQLIYGKDNGKIQYLIKLCK